MARPGDQLKPLTDLSASPAADRGPAPSADAIRNGLYVDRIGKTFGARAVVRSVSLRLARGEVAGLLGPNGAGKTTCFYMITGLILSLIHI